MTKRDRDQAAPDEAQPGETESTFVVRDKRRRPSPRPRPRRDEATPAEVSGEAKVTQERSETPSQPKVPDARPKARDAQPKARDAQPEARDAQPEARDAQPEARDAQPEPDRAEPKTARTEAKADRADADRAEADRTEADRTEPKADRADRAHRAESKTTGTEPKAAARKPEPAKPEPKAGSGLGAELEALRSEVEERTRDLQRVTAEYANYRRRVERDRAAVADQATGAVLTELLGVLDDLDRARDHGDLVGPFGAVADQLTSVLTKLGLAPFGEAGDAFDPSRHEAVAHSTSTEVTEPTCVQVFRRGYQFGERLLRPALVAVADPAGEPAEPAEAAEQAEVVDAEEPATAEESRAKAGEAGDGAAGDRRDAARGDDRDG